MPLPVDLGPHFPYLPRDGTSEQEFSYYLHELNDQTEELKRQFSILVLELQKDIEKSQKPVADVITILTLQNVKYHELLKDCKSLSEIFQSISAFISFFDFGLIKLLASYSGSTTFQKKMDEYKQKFQDYAKRRVCQCPSDAFGKVEGAEKVYVIKTEKDITKLTVEELGKLEYEMNKILGHKFLRLLNIKNGCVELVFRALEENYFTVTEKQRKHLSQLGVLTISYGNDTITINSTLPAGIPAKVVDTIDGE